MKIRITFLGTGVTESVQLEPLLALLEKHFALPHLKLADLIEGKPLHFAGRVIELEPSEEERSLT